MSLKIIFRSKKLEKCLNLLHENGMKLSHLRKFILSKFKIFQKMVKFFVWESPTHEILLCPISKFGARIPPSRFETKCLQMNSTEFPKISKICPPSSKKKKKKNAHFFSILIIMQDFLGIL